MSKLGCVTKVSTIFLLWVAAAIALPAQTFTTLHSFDGTDGQYPEAPLVQGANGMLYGTTFEGGASNDGTVFTINRSGALTTLHSFDGTDGAQLIGGLVQGTDGNFYGTTFEGGSSTNCRGGCGTIFKITPSGTLTTVHNFAGYPTDGSNSQAALIQAADGNFYGTTSGGGTNGFGAIFKLTPGGTLTILYSFGFYTDGASPVGGLVQAANGNFYGTAYDGGADSDGTVFTITPGGAFTTLYTFSGTDGALPYAGLVQAASGLLYGTTEIGGTIGYGTIFTITPTGTLTTLHDFDNTDGATPESALVQAANGKFYGTTYYGGTIGYGTVYSITASGTLTTLHSLDNTDGAFPYTAVVQATNGKFYGSTFGGGAYTTCSLGCGTVFSLSVGLGPFVETNPAAGKVGRKIGILGTDLTGATSVTFNGTGATFKVHSPTLIVAEVPSGATTGTIEVQLPSGTLSSNMRFTVLP